MIVALILLAWALVVLAAFLYHGAKHADSQGDWPVAGWAPGELEALVRARHDHADETDPGLKAWAESELDAMRRAFDAEGDE